MSADRHKRLGELFDALVEIPETSREDEALRLCPDDEALRREALALCAASGSTLGGVLDAPPPGLEDLLDAERPGEFIGPYRLVREAGEGGFGVVFEAEQTEPIKRRVALKLVKPGMDTRQVLARFNAERQTLARLDHPGIARVLDAGTTPRGRPYFLMDFIDGPPITEFSDGRRLPIRDRIDLFLQVCAAIEHAHQRGVIHRDLKPSNILVVQTDEGPSVRVIDFGIARALDSGADPRVTVSGQFVGTPAYMSPEQRAGDANAIDTRADVYALGVTLYELLTGDRPFDPQTDRSSLMHSPDKPSTRFSKPGDDSTVAAAARGSDPREIVRLLRGELDWIVLRAIEQDPARRYASVGDLAADLRRYLNNEPVQARPPSRLYVARKFVARNRAFAAAGAVSVLALVAAVIVSASFALSEARQRRATQAALDDAERERRIASATSEFMTDGLIAAALPTELGRDVKMRDAARFAAERLDDSDALADAPEIDATVRLAIADTLTQLGDGDTALSLSTRAHALRASMFGEDDPRTIDALIAIGESHAAMRRHPEAVEPFERAYTALEALYGADDGRTLRVLVRIGSQRLDMAEDKPAEEALRRAVEGFERLGAEFARDLYLARRILYSLLTNMGRNDEARPIMFQTFEQVESLFGADSLEMAVAEMSRADYASEEGRVDDAIAHYTRAIEIRTQLLGPDHGSLTQSYSLRSYVKFGDERFESAYADALEAARLAALAYGEDTLEAVLTYNNVLYMGMHLGAFEESEPYGLAAHRNAPATRVPPQAIAANLVTFYETWEKADPGKGHGAKAEQYRPVSGPEPDSSPE
jgi:serine/threonine protein kinase